MAGGIFGFMAGVRANAIEKIEGPLASDAAERCPVSGKLMCIPIRAACGHVFSGTIRRESGCPTCGGTLSGAAVDGPAAYSS